MPPGARPRAALRADERSELFYRPMRVLFIDFIGPIFPETPRGAKYMLTIKCPLSRYMWIKATKDVTADTVATVLVLECFFDVAGFPQI